MAQVLQLKSRSGTTVNLLNGTIQLRPGTWETRTSNARTDLTLSQYGAKSTFRGYDSVTETMGLVIQKDTVANIVAAINDIEEMQEKARRWCADPLEYDDVWLEWNADGESAKRSLVYDIRLTFPSTTVLSPMTKSGYLTARLSLTRCALWENTTTSLYQFNVGGSVSSLGGVHVFTNTFYGTAPGRIAVTRIYNSGSGATFQNIWMGLRDTYSGYTNFNSIYECESATAGTDTALANGVGCSPIGSSTNNYLACTFATDQTLIKRLQLEISDKVVDANLAAQAGTYIVLARCYLAAAGTVGMQLRTGISSMPDADFKQCEEVYFAEPQVWRLIELGEITVPAIGKRYEMYEGSGGSYEEFLAAIKFTELHLYAELITGTAGTTNLFLDCFVFIPATHYLKLIDVSAYTGSYCYFYTYADDTNGALVKWATNTKSAPVEFVARDWYLPTTGAMMVVAAERSTGQNITDFTWASLSAYTRWLSYRGS